MEKCELEITEECKIKMEADKVCCQKLGNHLGKLFIFLKLVGIPITENHNIKHGYFLDLLQKFCYPIFLHLSLVYLLYDTLSTGGLNYGTIIDTILPILPCVMWLLMRKQITSLKLFFAELNKVTSKNFVLKNRLLMFATNAGLCFIFVYTLLLFVMRMVQGNILNVKEIFRILQETIFPCTMVIVYMSNSYLLLQKLRFCKKMFHQRLDLACSSDVENMIKDYLDVMKSVEHFENLLCSVVFVLVLQDFCIATILIMDMILIKNWMAFLMLEALCELLFIFFSLGFMSLCAGNISIEIAAIKSVLLEKMFTQVDQDCSKINEKRINLLLNKDICILTAGKALVFDRVFVLKALVFIFAEVVFISELHWLLKY